MGSYSSRIVARNPIAYWKFNETSGTSFLDYSGNGRHGTYPGSGVTLAAAPGICGDDGDSAARFEGGSGQVPYNAVWRMNGSHTFSGWFRQTSAIGGGYPGLLSFGEGGSFTGTGGWIWFTGDVATEWRHHWKRSAETQVNTTHDSAAGFMNCLSYYVATYDTATGLVSMYLNGNLSQSVNVGTLSQIITTEAPLTIALNNEAAGQASHYFKGLVCHLALYDRALTANEILTDYQYGFCTGCPDRGSPPPVDAWRIGSIGFGN